MKLWLIAETGRQRIAIESSLVSDVLPALELERQPAATAASCVGRLSYRDQSIDVLDLGSVLYGKRSRKLLGNRIIIVDSPSSKGDGYTGLLAEKVLDTLEADTSDKQNVQGIPEDWITGVVRDETDQPLPCLDVRKLVTQPPEVPVSHEPEQEPTASPVETCWSTMGVFGRGDCPELQRFVHCRNCPTMVNAGRSVFGRPQPSGYQTELTTNRNARGVETSSMVQSFVFRSGRRWFGVESEFIEKIVAPEQIHRLPFRSNEILLGTANMSGELLLAYDIAPVFGNPDDANADSSNRLPMARMMVVRSQANQFILQVDDVLGIEDFPQDIIENELPADLPLPANPFVIGMVQLGEIRPILLNVELLLKQLAKEMHGTGRQPKKPKLPGERWTFANQLSEMPRMAERLEEFGEQSGLTPGMIGQLTICLDELFTNAVSYGYETKQEDEIELFIQIDDGVIELTLTSGGKLFDPFAEAPPPDLESDLEDRRVGGLGVHLVKEMVDGYSYASRDGRNIITLKKRLPAEERS